MQQRRLFIADLHCHSTVSDGELPPDALAARAHRRGVALWALTDHDTVAGVAEARSAAKAEGIAFVSGVEISVSFSGETIHIVGLGVDEKHEGLVAGLAAVRQGRLERARRIAEALEGYGFLDMWEKVLEIVRNPDLISRAHFARLLVQTGRFSSIGEVFHRFLAPGKPGYVEHEWARLEEVVEWIRAAGGVAVLAHPGRYRRLTTSDWECLLSRFRTAGGIGIEVMTSAHDEAAVKRWGRVCCEWGFLASCGSDFHAPGESQCDLGGMGELPEGLTPVWRVWQV